MFDWNDEELANILWGEQGKTDDHTVPYREGSKDYSRKKEWSQATTNIGLAEQNITETKTNIQAKRLGSTSNSKTISDGTSASGYGTDSLPGTSESHCAKTDEKSMGPGGFTDLKTVDSPRGKLDKHPEVFHHLDENKEQGDLIDYEWANIGTFDDFDRIFSNDDPLFGNTSIGNSDELWYPLKDVTISPPKAFSITENSPNMDLENLCEPSEIKKEFVQENEQSMAILECGKTKDLGSPDLQNALIGVDRLGYPGKSKLEVSAPKEFYSKGESATAKSCVASENTITSSRSADKVYWAREVPKEQIMIEGRNAGKMLQDSYSRWSPSGNASSQFPNQLPPSVTQGSLSSGVNSKQLAHGPQSLQGQHVVYATPSAYVNHSNSCVAMALLSHIQSANIKKKPLVSGYVTPSMNATTNNSADTGKHLLMTPQEKIVKLRRRQKMQAMLAIQKQQKQFSYQVSSTSHGMEEKSSQGSDFQQLDGNDAKVDTLSSLPLLYPNSQDDSSTLSYPVEDAIIYQLQDIIAKMDIRIRLCIRDSLLRLAQSAMERHYTGDTEITTRNSWDEQHSFGDNRTDNRIRFASVVETETETNPIDRTVANLLFHSPLELSEKYLEPPESPASIKNSYEWKTSENTSVLSFSDSSKQKQKSYYEGSAIAFQATEQHHEDHHKNNPCVTNSDNALNYGPANAASMEAAQ